MKKNLNIILISGASATGKTTIAHELGKHWGVNILSTDDIRIAMQKIHDADHPINFFLQDGVFENSSIGKFLLRHQEVSEIVCKGLRAVIEHHVTVGRSVIMEGDDILPEFAHDMEQRFSEVSAVFLNQEDKETVRANVLDRGRFVDNIPEESLQNLIELICADNHRLINGARELGLKTVDSKPFETLGSRIKDLNGFLALRQ